MSVFLTAGERVFGEQIFAPVLLFLLNNNRAFRKQLCSQHGFCVLAGPRSRAAGKAALGEGSPHRGNHAWSCLVVAAFEETEEAEHACLQNVVGPLSFLSLVNSGWLSRISLWLASPSSHSFSITVRLPDPIPSSNLYTSPPGLRNALPTHAPTAPKATVR